MIEIRTGRPEDYGQLMEQLVQSFREKNPSHPRFEPLYPDVIGPDAERMSHWRLAFVDGALAAGIEIIPETLRLKESMLRCGGIGNVHCWMPYRSCGCMSALLTRCIADMKAMGMSVSLLGGDRLRYGNYGWEVAGTHRQLSLTTGMKRRSSMPEAPSSHAFRFFEGALEDASWMLGLYESKGVGRERSDASAFSAVLSRPGLVTYLAEREAYVTVHGNSIAEYAGSCSGVEKVLRFLLKSGSWGVSVPPVSLSGETEAMFLSYASGYQVTPAGMCRVNDPAGALRSFLPVLRSRLSGWRGAIRIGVEGDAGVCIRSADGESVEIEALPAGAAADVVVSPCEMSRLFFGPFEPSGIDAVPTAVRNTLRLMFPLPLYWSPLDHV